MLLSLMMWHTTKENTEVAKENAQITRRIFEATHRPYVSIVNLRAEVNKEGKYILINGNITNFGGVPATSLTAMWRILVNNVEVALPRVETKSAAILPQNSLGIFMDIKSPQGFASIMGGGRVDIFLSAQYKGITDKQYTYEQESMYQPNENRFILIEVKAT